MRIVYEIVENVSLISCFLVSGSMCFEGSFFASEVSNNNMFNNNPEIIDIAVTINTI